MTTAGKPGERPPFPAEAFWWAWVLVCLVTLFTLNLPNHPNDFRLVAYARLPLEVPLILLGLLLLPRRLAIYFAVLSTSFLMLALLLKALDIGVHLAFQRRFNPYLDMKMVVDGWRLLSGTIGSAMAGLSICLAIILAAALAILNFRIQRRLIVVRDGVTTKLPIVAAVTVLVVGLGIDSTDSRMSAIVNFNGTILLYERIGLMQKTAEDMRNFERELAKEDDVASTNNLFAGVKGRDVVLVFVESYGRSSLEDPRYRVLIRPRLGSVQAQLQKAGLHAASGWLVSPTVGGLSWLAHGTFLSGLWIDSQARYSRLMNSERKSLNRLFQLAGWRTSAIMPAITMDWPEADYFGYDQILAADDLQYEGEPYNWVTMPDQYTLSAYERLARKPTHEAGKDNMAEIALISSHAPWTPVPTLIDWDDVGDGRVFNQQAVSGETPAEVWADNDSVREHYIDSIDYSLQTLGSYMERYGEDAIFIILGDHQPAYLVTGPNASRSVPIHIVSRDKALIDRFRGEGFTSGMIPASEEPELTMDSMRNRLIRLFGKPD